MSLSGCVECLDTPCRCGREYRDWSTEDVLGLIKVLQDELINRKVEARVQKHKEDVAHLYKKAKEVLEAITINGDQEDRRFIPLRQLISKHRTGITVIGIGPDVSKGLLVSKVQALLKQNVDIVTDIQIIKQSCIAYAYKTVLLDHPINIEMCDDTVRTIRELSSHYSVHLIVVCQLNQISELLKHVADVVVNANQKQQDFIDCELVKDRYGKFD